MKVFLQIWLWGEKHSKKYESFSRPCARNSTHNFKNLPKFIKGILGHKRLLIHSFLFNYFWLTQEICPIRCGEFNHRTSSIGSFLFFFFHRFWCINKIDYSYEWKFSDVGDQKCSNVTNLRHQNRWSPTTIMKTLMSVSNPNDELQFTVHYRPSVLI